MLFVIDYVVIGEGEATLQQLLTEGLRHSEIHCSEKPGPSDNSSTRSDTEGVRDVLFKSKHAPNKGLCVRSLLMLFKGQPTTSSL